MISLCCPTRGRPQAFAEMVATAAVLAHEPGAVEVVAYLDADDPAVPDYQAGNYPLKAELVVGERCTLSDAWNRAAAAASGDVLMLAADDLRFRTHRWDRIVEGSIAGLFEDGIGVVYGRDGHADGRMATHPFVTRRWTEVVGRFTSPYWPADYVDLWLHDVAEKVDRLRFLPGLFVEHMHYSYGKGDFDRTHQERIARAEGADLPGLWESLRDERAAEAERLREAIWQ